MKRQFLFLILFTSLQAFAQFQNIEKELINKPPVYTRKSFLVNVDTSKFVSSQQKDNGLTRTFYTSELEFIDIDDLSTQYVRITQPVMICIEGYYINKKKNGVFNYYIYDSLNPTKRYKIWEQNYKNDKLNGISQSFSIQGKLVSNQEYKDDSIVGRYKFYAIDGKTIKEEIEYLTEKNSWIHRYYNDTTGKLELEEPYQNGVLNGKQKYYYPNGKVENEMLYIDGKINGTRKHYYPSGKIKTEVEYRNGKFWTMLGTYDQNGKKLDGGTLKDGNGYIILYDNNANAKEVYRYIQGMPVQY